MIKLEGTILNVFTQQGGKDRKTGDQFEDRDKVQILELWSFQTVALKMTFYVISRKFS